jgi:DNA-binding CsgD family transcriptional regulator
MVKPNQALIVLTAAGRVAWLTPHAVQLLERVSPRTIHKHLEHILAKLGVENRSAALRVALELR